MAFAPSARQKWTVQLAWLFGLVMVVQAIVLPAGADEPTFSLKLAFGSRGSGPGQFYFAKDIALSPEGQLFVADAGSSSLQIFDQETGLFLQQFGSNSSRDAVKPAGVVLSPSGDIYVSDYDGGFIIRYGADLKLKETFSEFGSGPAQSIRPEYMSIYAGRLYVADSGNDEIDVFALSGNYLFSFGGSGTQDGQLRNPVSAEVNSIGEVFVSDLRNDRIQVFDKDGSFLRGWGRRGHGPGEFAAPAGISFDAHDNVYVGEIINNRVQVFRPDGTYLTAFGGTGTGPGQFRRVQGVAVNPETGHVFVADSANHRIQVFAPDNPAALAAQPTTD